MSTSASRQVRSARNALIEALGLGETYPLRDLPVTGEPQVVPFGGAAAIGIEDSEREVRYRLLDQAGRPLPGGAVPEAAGTGATLSIATPAITEDVTFTVQATRPNGRTALLRAAASIKVGLDASLPVAALAAGVPPIVIEHEATIEIGVAASQEGVTYRLVRRPSPDPAAPDDFAAVASDVPLSNPHGVAGTGGEIRLTSIPLLDDTAVRVRAIKIFDGAPPRPPQTTLLTTAVAVFVRPDPGLALAVAPPILDHAGAGELRIEAPQPGVAYRLHARPVADAEFSRADPPDPATIAVATPDGEVRIIPPPPTAVWEAPPGFEPVGDAATGAGGPLALPLPPRTADTLLIVEARKTHAEATFTSAERLDTVAAVLVRPDPHPSLRLEAGVADGKLVALGALAGQPGVFYAVAARAHLGELYLHQRDPAQPALNKGVGALAVSVDFVVAAAGDPDQPTSAAPPPAPALDLAPLELPAQLTVGARRAMTGLTAELGTATVAPLPASTVEPAEVAAGGSARVEIAAPQAGERYALLVNGRPVADPAPAPTGTLRLETGALAAGDTVELWASSSPADAAIPIERRTALIVVG